MKKKKKKMKNNSVKPIHACEQFFNTGKVHAMSYDFPSFSIDEKTFKYFVLDAVEEKFRQAQTSTGNYDPNLSEALTNIKHTRYSLEAQDISKKALTSALSITSQTKMSELSSSSEHIALSTTSEQLGHLHDKSKFAATLLMIKCEFSDQNYFKRVMESLDAHQDEYLTKEIKGLVANPPMDVISHIYKLDSKMAMENFPKQSKEIMSMEKPTAYETHKPIR